MPMINLDQAFKAKIRLLAEVDREERYRVYFEKEDFFLVSQIFAEATWRPMPVPPQVRMPHPVPAVDTIDYPYDEETRPLYSAVSVETIGKVSFFGADDVDPRIMRKIAKAVKRARSSKLPLTAEVDAVYNAIGSGYFVNIEKDRTYLYRRGEE